MGRAVTVWDRDGLAVWAEWRDGGRLLISGQDLRRGEYEYFLEVRPEDVPKVAAALGCAPGDVLSALVRHARTIVTQGELSWLRSIGVEARFFSP